MAWERCTLARPGADLGDPAGTNASQRDIWNLATHAADPNFLLASSVNGQVFCSTDAAIPGASFPGNSARSTPPRLGAELDIMTSDG